MEKRSDVDSSRRSSSSSKRSRRSHSPSDSSDSSDSSSSSASDRKRRRHRRRRRSSSSSPSSDSSSSSSSDEGSRKRKRRSSGSGSGSGSKRDRSDGDDDKEERKERRKRRREKREKRRKEKKKEKKKDRKKKEDKKREKEGKKGACKQWGFYGVVREADMFFKDPEFSCYLREVKKIEPEVLSNFDRKKYWKDYMEDFNTCTMPSKKFYDLAQWEARQAIKRQRKGLGAAQEQVKDEDALLERKKKEREEKAFRDAYRNARMEKQLQEIAKKEGKVYIPPV